MSSDLNTKLKKLATNYQHGTPDELYSDWQPYTRKQSELIKALPEGMEIMFDKNKFRVKFKWK